MVGPTAAGIHTLVVYRKAQLRELHPPLRRELCTSIARCFTARSSWAPSWRWTADDGQSPRRGPCHETATGLGWPKDGLPLTSMAAKLLRVSLCLAVLAATIIDRAASAQDADRVVAVADIHGNADGFAAVLEAAGLIDGQRRWIGGRATLVQTGDYTDRGPQVREAMDLLMRLEDEAAAAGGRVIVLLGNHEVMNMMRDLRYVTPEIYATFADERAEERRQRAYEAYVAVQLASGDNTSTDAWMEAHPPGYFAYQEAFEPDGYYGRWLRTKPVVAEIDGTVFLHGGIHPAVPPLRLDEKNAQARDELLGFDDYRRRLVDLQVILPFSTLQETLAAVRSALRERQVAGLSGGSQEAEPGDQEVLDLLSSVIGLNSWSIVNENGPLWFRGFALWQSDDGGPQITRLLTRYEAERFVVGHSVLRSMRITPRFDARVFLMDTGMLASRYPGGRPSALDIHEGRVTAIYLDEQIVLVEPAATGR